ncbi:Protein kinase domain-containing protein [Psidium guajava]|nr:Protein kinase domain-containing protein [Psidium guajava]
MSSSSRQLRLASLLQLLRPCCHQLLLQLVPKVHAGGEVEETAGSMALPTVQWLLLN